MTAEDQKNPIQVRFFERLKQNLGSKVTLAHDLSELMGISQDGIYRRMRGETVLSMDELVQICSHYKISPDMIASTDQNTATFQFRKINQRVEGLEDYLKSIQNDIERLVQVPKAHVLYAASDIPIFHHFRFPELTAFKIFYWQRAIMNIPEMDGKKFNPKDVRDDFRAMCDRIRDAYVKVASTEIWHMDTVVTNLTMLEYAWEAGWFDGQDKVLQVCAQFSEELSHIERQAVRNSKFVTEERWAENEGNFTMYSSEVFLNNNHVIVTAGPTKVAYITHNSFNTMATNNPGFVSETEAWLEIIKKKSVMISGVAEKQRNTFFRKAQEKVTALMERIKAS